MAHTLDYAQAVPKSATRFSPSFWRWSALALVTFLLNLAAVIQSLIGDTQDDCGPRGRTKSAIGPNSSVSQAIKMFRYCTGQFPKKLDELVRKPADPAIAAKWKGPYLRYSDDLLDPWKRPLGYRPPSMNAPTQVFLWSVGPDGVAGTPDDIRNW